MGIPQSVYPLFYWIRSLQISHERSEPTNATTYSVEELTVFDTRISHCPAECLSCEGQILIFVVRINGVSLAHHVVDVVDVDIADDRHDDSRDQTNDGHDDSGNLHDDADDVEQSFHIAPPSAK